ncbi:MAG TPA: hypothetical protein VFP64_11975, partial [Pyrinomonadaceae bacterium]|nr:hypothetical protein [Pyrinomonadaceae bacterium]
MKNNRPWAFAIVIMLFAMSFNTAAQTPNDDQKARPRTTTSDQDKDKKNQKPSVKSDGLEPDDTSRTPADVPDEIQANRQEQLSEEAALARYYNNFFNNYRLGPEDVISVDVFNQDRYSRK